MRTLEEIREKNKNYHQLFCKMEEKPIDLPPVFKEKEQEVYQNFVKPISRKTVIKHLV